MTQLFRHNYVICLLREENNCLITFVFEYSLMNSRNLRDRQLHINTINQRNCLYSVEYAIMVKVNFSLRRADKSIYKECRINTLIWKNNIILTFQNLWNKLR